MITKDKIKKLLLTEPMDVVDQDSAYFQVDEELDLEICVNFDARAKHDFDGFAVVSTYEMEITQLYLEKSDKFIPLDFTREELGKLRFSDEVEEGIKEKYLND